MGANSSSSDFCCEQVDLSRDPSKKILEASNIGLGIQQNTNKQYKGKIIRVSNQNSLAQINSSLQLYSILGKGYLENSLQKKQNFKEKREVDGQSRQNSQIIQPLRHKVITKKNKNLKNQSITNDSQKQSNSIKLVNSKLIESDESNSLRIKNLSDSLPKIPGYGLKSLSIDSSRPRIQSGRQNHTKNIKISYENFMQSNMITHRTRSRQKSIFQQTKVKRQKIQLKVQIDNKSQRQTIELQNGDLFQGQTTQDGEFEGEGVYTLSNGSVYKGIFKDGKAHGVGMYHGVDGFKYQGQWVDNAPQGYGKAQYDDGSTYAGYFIRGKRHGKGFFSKGKVTYNGDFVQDKMQGYGVYLSSTGQIYEGEWLNNMKHGKGLHKMSNGQVYEGQFKNDMKVGYGTMRYPNDSYYVGFWANDQIDKRRRPNRTQMRMDPQSIEKQNIKIL